MLRPFDGEHARHVDDPGLGDAIGGAVGQRDHAVGGGHADDAAGRAALDHAFADGLRQEEGAFEVGIHDRVPLFRREIERGLVQRCSGAVDQHVDVAEGIEHRSSSGLDAVDVGQFQRHGECAATGFFDFSKCGGEVVDQRRSFGDGNVVAFLCEGDGEGYCRETFADAGSGWSGQHQRDGGCGGGCVVSRRN